ncbi:Fe-S-cluster-containing dehydrogenase component [Bradyrhizobium sp. LM2.9]
MARMKFLCDADRCIECNACVTACKNEHDVPWVESTAGAS